MYNKHFGLTARPFSIAPNPRLLYMSPQHREALAHLLFGVGAGGGFVQLTGEVGTGKTTICRCLIERLPKDVDVALILNPRVSALELVASLCDELQISYDKETTSIKALTDALNDYLLRSHANGRRTVLIIDEAQCLSTDALEQVRLLTNLETTKVKLLQILLVGQPELRDLLARDDLRQLAQRITARYHLAPISEPETAAYIRHRLRVCGAHQTIFDDRAIGAVHRLSQGVPRLINVLCDRAMLGAFVEGKPTVDAAIVRKAATEVLPGQPAKPPVARDRGPAIVIGLLLVMGLGTAIWFTTRQSPAPDTIVSPAPDAPPTTTESTAAATAETSATPVPVPPPATGAQTPAIGLPDETPVAVQVHAVTPSPDPEVTLPDSGAPATEPTPPPTPESESESVSESASESESIADLLRVAGTRASASAWSGLYRLWGYDSRAVNDEQACAQAPSAGLSCIQTAGSWALLRRLDRPTLLVLNSDEGKPVLALMIRIVDDRIRLEIDGRAIETTQAEIDPHWYGAYRLLWKMPPSAVTALHPGARGDDVAWLRSRLERVTGNKLATADSRHYDDELQALVASFQREQRLTADGVAGAHTFIALNNLDEDPEIPRLHAAPDSHSE